MSGAPGMLRRVAPLGYGRWRRRLDIGSIIET